MIALDKLIADGNEEFLSHLSTNHESSIGEIKSIIIYQDDVLVFADNDDSLIKSLNAVRLDCARKTSRLMKKVCEAFERDFIPWIPIICKWYQA
jgi:hypothetical protein